MTLQQAIREVSMKLAGHAAIDPFFGTTSAARGAMLLSHIGQAPVIEGNEPRRIMTGYEKRLAEHTFDVRLPEDCVILHVIRKYPTGAGYDSIRHNPVTTIIYENYYDEYKTIGVLHVPEYMSFHQDFGFKLLKNKENWDRVAPGEMFAKDSVLAQSSTIKEGGLNGMGINVNVVFKSSPGTIEDGFVVSDWLLEQMAPRTYATAVGGAGRKAFFLNMYGTDEIYKPFPDIGDKIRDDGVVFALRDLDDDLSPAEMTPRALRELDRTFDRAVIGDPGAIVKDIKVFWDERQNPSYTPTGMDRQLRKYYDSLCNYYRELLRIYRGLAAKRKDQLRISEELSQLIVEAMIYLPQSADTRKLTRMYRLEQLDEWRVEVTYETVKIPGGAYKLTDFHGGKGVVCKVKPRAQMPRDQFGNICDAEIFGGSTMRRSNYGRIYEHGFNAASRDLAQRLRIEAGLDRHEKPTADQLHQAVSNTQWVEYAFAELQEFYSYIAPTMHEMLKEHPNHAEYVRGVLEQGYSYLYMPVDDQVHLPTALFDKVMNSRFCPNYGKVTTTNYKGEEEISEDNMLIAPLYMMLLEKIGEDWSAVASVKVQQFGLPSKLNNSDRSSTPGRESAIRSFGESETRSYNCTVGPEATVELLDQTNNPQAHIAVINSFLTAAQPSNIERSVDREKIGFGNSRPVGLMDHLLECRGLRFRYAPTDAEF